MKPQHTPGLLEQLQYIANKAHTLAGWKLEPGGHDVNIAELQEIEIKANKSIIAATDLLEACNIALHAVDITLCGTPSEHYFKAVKTALKIATATSIEDNLAVNVGEIKTACEAANKALRSALNKAEGKE